MDLTMNYVYIYFLIMFAGTHLLVSARNVNEQVDNTETESTVATDEALHYINSRHKRSDLNSRHKRSDLNSRHKRSDLNSRHKRGDCWNQWNISSSCYCGEHCWRDSYRSTFSANCGNSSKVTCCVLESYGTYQVSSNCSAFGTYLDFACVQTGRVCSDGQTPYSCTCRNGYLIPTSVSEKNSGPGLMVVIITACIVPIVVIGAVTATVVYIRFRKRRKSVEFISRLCIPKRLKLLRDMNRKVLAGVIPIQCNVMVVVDDVDEFKDYTKRLMIALENRFPKLVFGRVSRYDVLNDNYEIKCDRLLVFRKMFNSTSKRESLASIMKKVKFRSEKTPKTVAFVCVGNDVTNNFEERNVCDKLCFVPSLRHIDRWLPTVMKTLFDNNERCFSICNNSTYFIHSGQETPSNENCKELQSTVENILTEFGATVAKSENTAKCKLAFLDSVEDISLNGHETIQNDCFVFVSSGFRLDVHKNSFSMNVFGRKDTILGTVRLLYKLKLLSCKGLPNIEPIRYNPRTQEFVQFR